tara:strand:- start:73 stop:486 length:414 start_codon:yes stop_codon:yes gene_type:complete
MSTLAQNQPTVSPCQGDTVKKVLSVEMLTLFNQSGINLADYPWNNKNINCYINSAVSNYQGYLVNLKLGGYGVGLGVVGIPVGLAYRAALGTGTGWIIIGSACLVGGIYLIGKAFKQKKIHDSHIGVIGEYYRQNNI